jgi:hypothetical protein
MRIVVAAVIGTGRVVTGVAEAPLEFSRRISEVERRLVVLSNAKSKDTCITRDTAP